MPKAAVDEERYLCRPEDEIGSRENATAVLPSREFSISWAQSGTQPDVATPSLDSSLTQQRDHRKLGGAVAATPYAGHHLRALVRLKDVRHLEFAVVTKTGPGCYGLMRLCALG